MSFSSLGLAAELLHAVADQGYLEPTPIQAQAIPVILAGRDVMAAAQTGTGKTAGFTLPLLHRLLPYANSGASPAKHPVRCLILTPTRELCAQVEESVQIYGKHVALRSTSVYGGVAMDPQVKALRSGVEILVATPGRLLDHVQQKTLHLGQVEILVLDEADRMLDMGFINDIRKIIGLLPAKRQNLLFSATFSEDIKKLANGLLHDPVRIEVARHGVTAELVRHIVHPVDRERKRELLSHLIKAGDWQQVLVFSRTKRGASRLAQQLERDGISTSAIHGDKTQPARQEALAGFKAGKVRVLVATDVAARGLDIDQLPHVVNFELPHVAEDYVHRIGRTGRAGSSGDAISLVDIEEYGALADIERLIQTKIERRVIAGFELDAPRDAAVAPSRVAERREPRAPRATERPPSRSARIPRAPAPIDRFFTTAWTPGSAPASQRDSVLVKSPVPAIAARTSAETGAHSIGVEFGVPYARKPRQIPALLGGLAKKPA